MKNLERHVKFLPFAFMIHNIEEIVYVDNMNNTELDIPIYGQAQFVVTVLFFTAFGFIIVFGKSLYRNASYCRYAIAGFAGMLFLNAVFSHIIPSVYFMNYMSGVATAVLFLLPLSAYRLWKIHTLQLLSNRQLMVTTVLGGIAGIAFVFGFLNIAYLLTN